ncbi:MAG: AIR synthase-related protein [Opitutaceae bacterium]
MALRREPTSQELAAWRERWHPTGLARWEIAMLGGSAGAVEKEKSLALGELENGGALYVVSGETPSFRPTAPWVRLFAWSTSSLASVVARLAWACPHGFELNADALGEVNDSTGCALLAGPGELWCGREQDTERLFPNLVAVRIGSLQRTGQSRVRRQTEFWVDVPGARWIGPDPVGSQPSSVPRYLDATSSWSPERSKWVDPAARDLQVTLVKLTALLAARGINRPARSAVSAEMARRWAFLHPHRGASRAMAMAWLSGLADGRTLDGVEVHLQAPSPAQPEARFLVDEWVSGLREAALALSVRVTEARVRWSVEEGLATASLRPVFLRSEVSGDAFGTPGHATASPGDRIVVVGGVEGELPGSLYQETALGSLAGVPLAPDYPALLRLRAFCERIRGEGLVTRLRAVGEAGLLVAVFTLLTATEAQRGALLAIHPREARRRDSLLLGEDGRRLVAIVPAEREAALLAAAVEMGVPALAVGEVTDGIALALQLGGLVMAWRVESLRPLLQPGESLGAPPASKGNFQHE